MAGRVLLTALALVALSVAPAPAHQSDPTIVARIDSVEPPIEGVVVEVRSGVADQLLVVNLSDEPVEVLGENGTAFLRITRNAVEADVTSRDWHASMSPLLPRPSPGGPPRWTKVANHGSWGWFDHRLHDEERLLPQHFREATSPVRLAEWAVPLRHGGRAHDVKGHVEFRPVVGAFRSRVTAKPDGMDVDVLDGRVPGLFVRWKGNGTLVVKGTEGEPFARFRRDGVEVNAGSGTWGEDRVLRGQEYEVPPLGEAVWRREATSPALTWLDRRLAYTPGVPPDAVVRSSKPTTMVEWDVPVEVDGRAATISGETTWHPSRTREDKSSITRVATVAAAAAAVVVGAAVARGRRRRRVES